MKKSINAWSADPGCSREELYAGIREAGFEGIELNVDGRDRARHALSMETDGRELAEIAALSEKYGLPVVSIATGLWWSVPMGDPAAFEGAAALLEQQLRCAKALGAKGILTVPGGNGGRLSLKSAWENCVRFLQNQREIIRRYGVVVGVENVWNGFFTSPFDVKLFLEQVGDPLVKAYYDVGNTVAFSATEDWIEILGGDIGMVHIKDFRRKDGRINAGGDFVDLTEGSVDWPKAIAALVAAGYDGPLTAEVSKSDPALPYPDYYRLVSAQEDRILSC